MRSVYLIEGERVDDREEENSPFREDGRFEDE